MTTPNTFIVGAPKCGTTALCHYLDSHPNVFMCDPKEPHYFAYKDMPGRKHYYSDLELYLSLFDSATENQSTVVEGSVWYLYCESAITNIKAFSPDAKIVVMLRRPDEMVHSYHSQSLVSFNEDIADFETAWRLSTDSQIPRPIPEHCDDPSVLQYGKIAAYGTQLNRLCSIYPEEQILVMLFDDLSSDPHSFYTQILEFLNLPIVFPPSFEKINENKSVRNKTIGRFLTYPPKPALIASSILKKALGIDKLNLRARMLGSLSTTHKRAPISTQLKSEIIEHYRLEILTAQDIIGRDLSHWLD